MTKASFEKEDQHWYYCRRGKNIPQLNNHGALRTAQTTTTNSSGVTTDKLLSWYGTVDETLNELDLCNYWHEDWEGIKNSKNIDSFWGNMYETRISPDDGKFLQSLMTMYFVFLSYFAIIAVSHILYFLFFQELKKQLHLNTLRNIKLTNVAIGEPSQFLAVVQNQVQTALVFIW